MDGQQMDQIARALARGMSRRGALKGVAGALGLAAAGTLGQPRTTVAQCAFSGCTYINRKNGHVRNRCVAGTCPGDTKTWTFNSSFGCYSILDDCRADLGH
jgi:hypothetical protein